MATFVLFNAAPWPAFRQGISWSPRDEPHIALDLRRCYRRELKLRQRHREFSAVAENKTVANKKARHRTFFGAGLLFKAKMLTAFEAQTSLP